MMRPRTLLLLFLCPLVLMATASYRVIGGDPGPWTQIFGSVGFQAGSEDSASIFVLRDGKSEDASSWTARVEGGAYLILEGDSPVARSFGFAPRDTRVTVSGVQDLRRPELSIVWERKLELAVFDVPHSARIFCRERRQGAPLLAGFRRGAGAVLWVATSPGERGFERFPFLLHALSDLGLQPPFRSRGLWAFFDSAYRARADLDYLADRWREAGVSALHVAAWHYFEPDPQRDSTLRALIDTCHRRGILAYAWVELPHVSEQFWEKHPEWREKTALLQDAHLDWRYLMNLTNRDCFRTAAAGVRGLIERFEWDGVNLAELYFESLQGHATPSRFTPMNDDVRREFRNRAGFDPVELFDAASPHNAAADPSGLRSFLDYRAELAIRIQSEWITELENLRLSKPDLDLVLTHIDDRAAPETRDTVGADASAALPLLDRHRFTFLVEDPATVWNRGPERYAEIARNYSAITPHRDRLAIDINIVERYQDVYPTKQQTGIELFQLVNSASRAFPRVALYFEKSILAPDVPWLASAAAAVERCERVGTKLFVESRQGVGVPWKGAAEVNGKPWPALDGETVWLPPGRHSIAPSEDQGCVHLLSLTGNITSASCLPAGMEFAYRNEGPALALFDKRPVKIEVDGSPRDAAVTKAENGFAVRLPRGQHVVTVGMEN